MLNAPHVNCLIHERSPYPDNIHIMSFEILLIDLEACLRLIKEKEVLLRDKKKMNPVR